MKFVHYVIICFIVILVISLFKYNHEYFSGGPDIITTLKSEYNNSGLLFRGLECDLDPSGASYTCITKEIEGPHEPCFSKSPPCKGVSPDQGATTFLQSGMNPIFYSDINSGFPVFLIFNTSIVTSSSCAYNQDAGHNGCRGTTCDSTTGTAKNYPFNASQETNPNSYVSDIIGQPSKCNPRKDYICIIPSGNDPNVLLDNLKTTYNKFMNNFISNIKQTDGPCGPGDVACSFTKKIKSGCGVMKENQVSAFWDKEKAINSGALLAIGVLHTKGTNITPDDTANYNQAVSIQAKISGKYGNVKIPIVILTRNIKPTTTPITNINNGKIYMAEFDDLVFTNPTTTTDT